MRSFPVPIRYDSDPPSPSSPPGLAHPFRVPGRVLLGPVVHPPSFPDLSPSSCQFGPFWPLFRLVPILLLDLFGSVLQTGHSLLPSPFCAFWTFPFSASNFPPRHCSSLILLITLLFCSLFLMAFRSFPPPTDFDLVSPFSPISMPFWSLFSPSVLLPCPLSVK